jgi:cyclopropane fatty-acyl-phospholipid synthase-like methyltransferase
MDIMYTQGEYLKNNPTWHTEDSRWKASQITKCIKRNNLDPSSICEVGCGAGEILNQLHSNMANNVSFYGYEISPQAYNLCIRREKTRLKFFLKDILKAETVFFDLVLIIDVIEHIEDCFTFLRNLHSKGQFKMFHIPLSISAQTAIRNTPIISCRRTFGHIHDFTKDTALELLKETGYEIIDYFYTPAATDLRRSFKSTILCIPRKIVFKINEDMAARLFSGYSLMVLTK